MGGLLAIGSRKPLELSDLWDVARCDEASTVSKRFQKCLQLTADDVVAPQGIVWRGIVKAHWRRFALAGTIKFVHDIIVFAGERSLPDHGIAVQQCSLLLSRQLASGHIAMLTGLPCYVACIIHASPFGTSV